MAGGLGQRAGLAKTRHPAKHQAGIARLAGLGPQAQALGHARAPALNQYIGAVDQAQRGVAAGGLLDVQRHRAAVAAGDIKLDIHWHAQAAGLGAVDAQHLGAQVGQQHGAQRPRADAGHLDNAQSGQGSHVGVSVEFFWGGAKARQASKCAPPAAGVDVMPGTPAAAGVVSSARPPARPRRSAAPSAQTPRERPATCRPAPARHGFAAVHPAGCRPG